MAKFDDLTQEHGEFLQQIAAAVQDREYEQFMVLRTMGNSTLSLLFRDTQETLQNDAPRSDAFYEGLYRLGYLDAVGSRDLQFRLTQRALDYTAYAGRSNLGRSWEDLCYDLGQGQTLRSRLLWSIFAIVVSVLLAHIDVVELLRAAL